MYNKTPHKKGDEIMEKKCIVCGNDNPRPRAKFCCKACEQKYYYQKSKEKRQEYKKEHYQEHKQEYIDRANDWQEKNRERWNEFQREYRRLIRAKAKEENNNE